MKSKKMKKSTFNIMWRKTIRRALASFCLGLALCVTVNADPVTTKHLSVVPQYVQYDATSSAFCIASNGKTANIYVSPDDWQGVIRAAKDLGDDIRKVTGTAARVVCADSLVKESIIVGTIGKSPLIDKLVSDGRIDVSKVKGQWESFVIQTVGDNLVVAGSDKRGTIYGIYDISEKIGVSPWYWWADVPARHSASLYVKSGRYVQPSPKVKYRGIFINDEWPSFGGWASAKFGGINSKVYAHIFELLLRLKANYFWPAMWGSAFNEDDPQSPVVADMYGIVMGTSHHEPMMRAHKEYTKRRDEVGEWNYATNKANLDKFFTDGLTRNKNYENIITIGMRGDGDKAMSDKGDEENMKILADVVAGQREIIRNVYDKDPSEVPQLWAIFTEVQRYYDKGFTVPDDVMLLFCDNNWGYMRRTGPEKEKNRKGGMGLYYHIDMNGGPNNDRWVNNTTIPKLREQFNLAYRTGIDDLWIVNVGDLKPKEIPIDFIMRYAWDPDMIAAEDTDAYMTEWAAQNFGDKYATDIADIISQYTKYNLGRKAEVQTPGVFSVSNHREADRVDALWKGLEAKAETIRKVLPAGLDDAYYQLVYYPTVASSGVARIYNAITRNRHYAYQGRPSANDWSEVAKELFERDKRLSAYYNDTLANGKWKRMMSDVHIGYVKWSMPKENKLPKMKKVAMDEAPLMGGSVEGNDFADNWNENLTLPMFDFMLDQTYYIDVFNRGNGSFKCSAKANKPWIVLKAVENSRKGQQAISTEVDGEKRIWVAVDWNKVNDRNVNGIVELEGGGKTIRVAVNAFKCDMPNIKGAFFGNLSGSEFSIPADKYDKNIAGSNASWTVFPDLGRGGACMGVELTGKTKDKNAGNPAVLEYRMLLPEKNEVTLCIGILPTQDIQPERGLRLAVALDDGEPVVLDARQGFYDEFREYTPENLALSKNLKPLPKVENGIKLLGFGQPKRNEVFDNMRWLTTRFKVKEAGLHTLKLIMVDPEVVLERIVVNPDNNHPSYFGAPERQFLLK